MNILSSFSDFYDNLSSDGVFFFWIIVFLFVFLVFLTVVLVYKNKKLVKLLNEEDNYNNSLENDSIIIRDSNVNKEKQEDVIDAIDNIEKKEVIVEKKEDVKKIDKPVEVKENLVKEENGPYKKNVLREMNARMQTSPISIDRVSTSSDNFGFDESYLREDAVSPLEMMEDTYEVNDSMKFASEIVEKMEEEIKPSNIELTDYEKKQEEEAIISYDELLKVKDKIYNLSEDEETDEFIDELKSFRLDL